jgi:hypothetical protein
VGALRRRGFLLAAAVGLWGVACFSIQWRADLACSQDRRCPSGLVCAADWVCRAPSDAAGVTGLPDVDEGADVGVDAGTPPPSSVCAQPLDLGGNILSPGRYEDGLTTGAVAYAQASASSDSCFGTGSLTLCPAVARVGPFLYFSVPSSKLVVGHRYRFSSWVKVPDPARVSAFLQVFGNSVSAKSFPSTKTTDWQSLTATIMAPDGGLQPSVNFVSVVDGGVQTTDCIKIDQVWFGTE